MLAKSPQRRRATRREVATKGEDAATDLLVPSPKLVDGLDDAGTNRLPQDGSSRAQVNALVALVQKEYVEIMSIWNSIGIAPEKQQEEGLLLQREIEELFHRRRLGLAQFTEEMEKEIASLQATIAELRETMPDLDMSALACGVHDPKAHLYIQMEQLRAIRDLLQYTQEERQRAMRELHSRFLVLCDELYWRNETERAHTKDENGAIENGNDSLSGSMDGGVDHRTTDEGKGCILPADFFLPPEHDLSEARLTRFKLQVENGEQELDDLKKQVSPLKSDIADLWKELYMNPDPANELDNFVVGRQPCTSIEQMCTYDIVNCLKQKKSKLEEERSRRRRTLDKTLEHINELWTMLHISEEDEDRKKFIAKKNALPAYSLEQLAVCKEERRRLEKVSESKIKDMIEEERNKLKKLWENLHMTDEQIQQFLDSLSIAEGKYSFDVLEAMRVEVRTLTERLARMGPLINLIVRREWIKNEMKAFERKASEPSRLFGRSTQLLEEEKFRKIVANEFPRLTDKLQRGLVKYESKYKESFVFQGKRYLKTMQDEQQQPNFALLHLKLFSGTGNDEENPVNKQNLTDMVTVQKKDSAPSKKAPSRSTTGASSSSSRTRESAHSMSRSTSTSTPTSTHSTKSRKTPPREKMDNSTLTPAANRTPKLASREENLVNGSRLPAKRNSDQKAQAGSVATPSQRNARTGDARTSLNGASVSRLPNSTSTAGTTKKVSATPARGSTTRADITAVAHGRSSTGVALRSGTGAAKRLSRSSSSRALQSTTTT